MKRNNKKGFTIVELTIVIAVIAILAAVLIPTFSSVVDKANQSADIQLIRQANVVLQAATADGSSLSEKDAIDELEDNSITLGTPSGSDNEFYYIEEKACYVIWNRADSKISYPEDVAQSLKNWTPGNSAVRIGSTYYATLKEAVNEAATGNTIYLLKDIETKEQVIINKNITIDFNKHTYSVKGMNFVRDHIETSYAVNNTAFNIENGATVLLKNGTVKMLSGAYSVIYIPNGHLTVTDMVINTDASDAFRVPVYGVLGSFTVNNTQMPGTHEYSFMAEAYNNFELTINGTSSLKKIMLRFNTNKVTVNSTDSFAWDIPGYALPTSLTMKLAKGDYPNVNGYTWSEPDKDGYRTLTKNP